MPSRAPTEYLCEHDNYDVVFLMDQSGSLGSDGFERQVSLAQDIMRRTLISGMRVGAVGFGNNATSFFGLQEFDSDEDAAQLLAETATWGDEETATYMGAGIKYALDEVFDTDGESRYDFHHINAICMML